MREISNINKRKKNLILSCLHGEFESMVGEKLKTTKFNSIEEMDEWVDKAFREHVELCDRIELYYKQRIEEEENE